MIAKAVAVILLTALTFIAHSQNDSKTRNPFNISGNLFAALDKKASSAKEKLDKQTDRYLANLQKQEHRLRKKVWRKDSVLAKQLFDGVDEKYSQLKNGLADETSSVYSGHLDSLTTAISFLKNQNLTDNSALQKSLDHYMELQLKLNAAENIRKYMTQRRELLKQQVEKLGMVKELKQYSKQVYYYQQQVREYKQIFEAPNKIEAKLMEIAMQIPQFKDFFAKNSMLGSMFALPGNNGTNPIVSLNGLQTRALILQTLTDHFGTGANVSQTLQQNVQSAQGQLSQLKNKLSSYKNGSYENTADDDFSGFKPNGQKTKSFLQRLEYGVNIQSQKARYFFPVTSDIALSLGYKINHNSVIGIGASYKLGWGNSWNSIKLSHQGVGLRSYIDWKIKGKLYLSGGYEQNYKSILTSITQLQDYSAWQTSGLVGVSKRYIISKKMKGEMKLLWDFMSYQQVPKAQPILFRVGYSIQ